MKKATCLLLSLLIFATPILAQELENPCEGELYIELKNKTLESMTEREYTYFIQKDKACEKWKLSVNTKIWGRGASVVNPYANDTGQ